MSDAWNVFGTKLLLGNLTEGDSTVYTEIAEPTSYGELGYDAGTFDATNHQSTGGFAEFVASKIKRWTPFECEFNFLPTNPTQDNLTGLMAVAGDGLRHDLRLALSDPDTTQMDFLAFILNYRIVLGGIDGIPKLRTRFQPTGALGVS